MALPFQFASAVVLILCAFANSPVRAADCVDVSAIESLSLSGRLANRTYPDTEAPLRDDNREATESAYILQLDSPGCFVGDQFLGGEARVSEVQLLISAEGEDQLFSRLRRLIGGHVTAVGNDAFGAHTPHHHAPVVLVLTDILVNLGASITGKSAVEGFYLALAAGDGTEAARHIIPAKRKRGPLSAAALSWFYGNLRQPLELLQVADLGDGRYRASYRFETKMGAVCRGSSVVTTSRIEHTVLISRIVAENGC